MMKQPKILSVSEQKNFIVAKTTVEKKKLLGGISYSAPLKIAIRSGCALYCYIHNENGFDKKQIECDGKIIENISTYIDLSKNSLPDYVTLLWVRGEIDNKISISVPWGIASGVVDDYRYHGNITVRCSVDKILQYFAETYWEVETTADGIIYEYLSEYYVVPNAEEDKQYGISIELREILLSTIKKALIAVEDRANNQAMQDSLANALKDWREKTCKNAGIDFSVGDIIRQSEANNARGD